MFLYAFDFYDLGTSIEKTAVADFDNPVYLADNTLLSETLIPGTSFIIQPGETFSFKLNFFLPWEADNKTNGMSYNLLLFLPIQPLSTYNVTYDGVGYDGGTVPVDNNLYIEGDTVTILPDLPIHLAVGVMEVVHIK